MILDIIPGRFEGLYGMLGLKLRMVAYKAYALPLVVYGSSPLLPHCCGNKNGLINQQSWHFSAIIFDALKHQI